MILNINGGGGVNLNFDVVSGTTQPENPTENMIWVNMETPVNDVCFSVTKPENPVSGTVWICTGTSSPVSFNALKKNAIMIYPLYVEYFMSSWYEKEAEIYQKGLWSDFWDGSILVGTNQYENITGGWLVEGGIGTNTAINEFGIDFTRFETDNDYTSWAYAITKNKIDITNYNTISFDCKYISGGLGSEIGISRTASGTEDLESKINPPVSTNWQNLTLDISSFTGEVYIVARAKKNVATYNNIKLS